MAAQQSNPMQHFFEKKQPSKIEAVRFDSDKMETVIVSVHIPNEAQRHASVGIYCPTNVRAEYLKDSDDYQEITEAEFFAHCAAAISIYPSPAADGGSTDTKHE